MNDTDLKNRNVLTPTALNSEVRLLLERQLPLFWIEGEISNLRPQSSQHLYFSLKDPGAEVRCVMFRNRAMYLRFKPGNGAKVLARARVTLYEPRGDYQLQIDHLEPQGQGDLMRQFEQLKASLAAEGLFASERKRVLPRLPTRIAIVTSPQAAALHDVLNVLARRYPLLVIDLYPSLVQGAEAAAQLRAALNAADRSGRYDLILLTRGGGSIEDLWAFNDEALARAIASAKTPVVAAIGHEVDFTIADFVADLRAPTPSAAAEMIAPAREELAQRLDELNARLEGAQGQLLERLRARLHAAERTLLALHPDTQLAQKRQALQLQALRLQAAFGKHLEQQRADLQQLDRQLTRLHPAQTLREHRQRLNQLGQQLRQGQNEQLDRKTNALRQLAGPLHALSPLATLARGYAIAFDTEQRVLTGTENLKPGDPVRVRLHQGQFAAQVTEITPG